MGMGIKMVTCLGTELLIYEIDLDGPDQDKKKERLVSFCKKNIVAWLKQQCVKQVRAVLIEKYLVVMVAPATPPWGGGDRPEDGIPGFADLLRQPPTVTADILLDEDFGHQECAESSKEA